MKLHLARLTCWVLAGLLLAGATGAAGATDLTAHQRHDLRCAAAFAVVAVAQTRGDRDALALPPLGIRGKRYLGLVGETLVKETGQSAAAVHTLLTEAAAAVAHDGATGVASACLGDLDAVVPPHPPLDTVACAALLGVYADVLAARDDRAALAADLARAAADLERAARAQMATTGLDAPGQAAALALARDRMRAALNGGAGAIDADDFTRCRRLTPSSPAPR